jgi:thiol-disulfide isomerase/thioredoxin
MRIFTVLCLALGSISCGGPIEEVRQIAAVDALRGEWRAVLQSPGGELPFGLRVTVESGRPSAVILNDVEEVPTSSVSVNGDRVVIDMDWYDSKLEGRLSKNGLRIDGSWTKVIPGGVSQLGWVAEKGAAARFRSPASVGIPTGDPAAVEDVAGSWRIVFTDEGGTEQARGEFIQDGTRVTGTMLTGTGDYRYLDGSYEDGVLRLSTFDGAHAFLFQARATAEGGLAGDFWSRDSYHATWTADRIVADTKVLSDPWNEVTPTADDRRFRFSFDDLEGNTVSSSDPRFAGKVVLVNLFGSWCPNCNDEAPLLAEWHRRWSSDGLEVVGLAFEFSGDGDRDRRVLRRFKERYGIGYPLLLAGTSDKAEAALAVPDISAVPSYPTTIFIGRDGRIRWIHSGFAGPGTGAHHERLVAEMEKRIAELIAEAGDL